MLKYLVILLDDTSPSYCHYENLNKEHKLITLDDLKAGILFAMKENLMIQFVYPDYELPTEYKDTINSIDHSKIVSLNSSESGDVVIINGVKESLDTHLKEKGTYVLRIGKEDLFNNISYVKGIINAVFRLNIVLTDVDTFNEDDFITYEKCLKELSHEIEQLYSQGRCPQLNLLTDRMILTIMNNCNAGDETITLAPDGKFYVCPAFYLIDENKDFGLGKSKFSIGNLSSGLDIKNAQLYKLNHAPICRNCDAYHCKRCIWLNRKTTYEVNTPSHEQCKVAHLERNESRELLLSIRKYGEFLPHINIDKIMYLDPFEMRKEWLF